jgi:AcrR family transcriptional regulator
VLIRYRRVKLLSITTLPAVSINRHLSQKGINMAAKLDRRVRRTRRLLADALLTLVTERPYEMISVQDITDEADLNRATFYLHYGSKDELMVAALEARFDALVAEIEVDSAEKPIWEDTAPVQRTFEHVAEHAALYKVLLSERGMGYIVNRIISYIAGYSETHLLASLPPDQPSQMPPTLIAQHIAGSLFALLAWWIQNDMPYSAETMAQFSQQLQTQGCLPLLESTAATA